jgi:asparagine synthase (glutamine-hydrolysing)
MCGVVGFSGRFSDQSLREAGNQIAHRGPDDSGEYLNEQGIGLAFRRLAIIDLSPLGAQPMASPDGTAVIVFNGEIYNFRELRENLVSRGVTFRSHSDTEVLLQLYLAEGEKMLTRLNGIFAFAIWDARDRSLLIARDALGVKPLYYASTDRGFAFASEIKALVRLVPEIRELDPLALHRYLTFLWCPGAGTPFKAVRKLLPGEAIRVRAGQIERCWSWYRLPFFRPTGTMLDEGSAVSGTTEHLRRAVHRQLVADVPVGAFLSGGLDSSAVVTFAREQVPDIRCFTIESAGEQDAGFTDDLPYARRVAKHLDVPLDVVTVDASAMANDLERMVGQLDEPLADPAPLNVLYISQLARRHGIKVLLSGAGGDDLFSGYRRHVALHYERYWRWLPQTVRAALDSATKSLDQRHPGLRRLAKLFNGAGLERRARLTNYFRWIRETELFALYAPDFRRAASAEAVDQPMLDVLNELPAGTTALNEMLVLEQRFFLADHNLIYTDKMSMAAGVETRVPFLDLDLVDFAARIPECLKQRGTVGKWVLKKAMEPFLPMDVIYRPKTGFGAPLRRWMRGELRPLLGDLLSSDSVTRRGIFDAAAVHRFMRRNELGEEGAAYTLLSLMSIEIWCRKFIDGSPVAANPPEAVAAEAGNRI